MAEGNGPRRQQAEERREQILDAALRVFSEKGFAGASIRDIAREVGVTEGLLYHYFESKERLMDACWRERSWTTHLEQVLARAEKEPLPAALRLIAADFLKTLYQNAPMVRINVSELQHNRELSAVHLQKIQEHQHLIAQFMARRQQQGQVRADADLGEAAGMLMGSAFSLFLLWNREEPAEWERRIACYLERGVDVIVNGLAAGNSA